MITLKKYADFKPSAFDTAGLGLPDRQGWLVAPVGVNRDADCLTQANWQAGVAAIEKAAAADAEDSWETPRFGHWACGWLQICIVRPGSAAALAALKLAQKLENYPVLDEDLLGELEYTQEQAVEESYASNCAEWDRD